MRTWCAALAAGVIGLSLYAPNASAVTVDEDLLDTSTSAASPSARDAVHNAPRREHPCEADKG